MRPHCSAPAPPPAGARLGESERPPAEPAKLAAVESRNTAGEPHGVDSDGEHSVKRYQ
jgi:hypothetical protein